MTNLNLWVDSCVRSYWLRVLIPALVVGIVLLFATTAHADVVVPKRDTAAEPWSLGALALALFGVVSVASWTLFRRPSFRETHRGPYRTPAKAADFVPERRSRILDAGGWVAAAFLSAAMSTGGTMALSGCTAATEQAVVADLGAIVGALPGECAIVTAIDGSAAGQVCSTVAGDAQVVAGLLQGILSSLPASSAKIPISGPMANAQPVVWILGGGRVTVQLRADLAPLVQEAAKARRAAKGGAK